MRKTFFLITLVCCFFSILAVADESDYSSAQLTITDPQSQFEQALQYDRIDANQEDFNNALLWYQKAAEQHHQQAAFNLASMHEKGIGTIKDPVKALYWYQRAVTENVNIDTNNPYNFLPFYLAAATQGNVYAQYKLAIIYEQGTYYQTVDTQQALHWYQKAAEQNFSDAMTSIGYLYEESPDLEQDYQKAFYWYQKAALLNNKIAQYNLGLIYQYGKGQTIDYPQAVEWYNQSADQGYVSAMFALAYLYEVGNNIPQDYNKAIMWYTKAAELGQTDCQYNLALIYEFGKGGVTINNETALYWYTKAAESGDGDAMERLGYFYQQGDAVEQDDIKALYWYQQAADVGNMKAQYNLGIIYEFGYGTEINLDDASKWYLLAADQGSVKAIFRMGYLHESGKISAIADYNKAFYYYDKAANEGYPPAQNNLGYFYDNGYGVKQDQQLALYWYQQAAEQNDEVAQYNLGLFYQYGKAVPKNKESALYWYKKSADNDYVDAIVAVAKLYQKQFRNQLKAAWWYTKAAKQGNAESANQLGEFEQNKKNYSQALVWYTQAAENNYLAAQYNLANLLYGHPIKENALIEAYAWAYIADQNGHKQAKNILNLIADKLSPSHLVKAQQLAVDYLQKYKIK